MKNIFAKIPYELEKNHDLMLVTIITDLGSSPRGTGSQMLVNRHGHVLGTIGGGAVELNAERLAVELLEKRCSGRHSYELRANADENIGMVCGGDVELYFQFIDSADPGWRRLCLEMEKLFEQNHRGWLVQHLDGSMPTLLDGEGLRICGSPVTDPERLMKEGNHLAGEDFSMPLPIGERVIIFGGGHCAYALAPLLRTVGFRVVVMDEREEFVNASRFPGAESLICGDFTKLSDFLSIGKEDYLVIMTNGHSHDFEVQEQVLRGEFAYVGVIGSSKKTAAVNEQLRQAGVSEDAIRKVHTPIGTAIRAVTPEEIAVSIAGEMILCRAQNRDLAGVPKPSGCPMH